MYSVYMFCLYVAQFIHISAHPPHPNDFHERQNSSGSAACDSMQAANMLPVRPCNEYVNIITLVFARPDVLRPLPALYSPQEVFLIRWETICPKHSTLKTLVSSLPVAPALSARTRSSSCSRAATRSSSSMTSPTPAPSPSTASRPSWATRPPRTSPSTRPTCSTAMR